MKCRRCQSSFELTEQATTLLAKLSPNVGDRNYPLPPPTLCPQCRRQRRQTFRNERTLYRRNCALTGTGIISNFSPQSPFQVYSVAAFLSDGWDPISYGRAFDFGRPFFEQFAELYRAVPQPALCVSPDALENNCPYVNFAGFNKNCHMIFDSDNCEECYFSNVVKASKVSIDCSYLEASEFCYQCIDCKNGYDLKFCQNCTNCSNSMFLKNCIGCSDCFLCSNLNQKKYHIRNQPYSPEAYRQQMLTYRNLSADELRKLQTEFEQFCLQFPQKYCVSLRTENCTGSYLYSSKNCIDCYSIDGGEDLLHCESLFHGAKDCLDVSSFGEAIQQVYESATIGVNAFQVLFSLIVVGCRETLYSINCRDCANLLGCVGLRRAKNCILNTSYTTHEYEQLAQKILNHVEETKEWGEFFPTSISPFAYNESMAQLYDPLDEATATSMGFRWRTIEPSVTGAASMTLPQRISETSDEVVQQILACESCQKRYKLIQQEVAFYRSQDLPPPRICPDCRHVARINSRNPAQTWERSCQNCSQSITSSYPPGSRSIVYCEQCYQESLT